MRQQYGYSDSDIICFCTGELNANKNQQLLVNVLAELRESCPNFKILFAGAGDKFDELKALAKNEALRLEMGQKAKERAQKYSSERVKKELEYI